MFNFNFFAIILLVLFTISCHDDLDLTSDSNDPTIDLSIEVAKNWHQDQINYDFATNRSYNVIGNSHADTFSTIAVFPFWPLAETIEFEDKIIVTVPILPSQGVTYDAYSGAKLFFYRDPDNNIHSLLLGYEVFNNYIDPTPGMGFDGIISAVGISGEYPLFGVAKDGELVDVIGEDDGNNYITFTDTTYSTGGEVQAGVFDWGVWPWNWGDKNACPSANGYCNKRHATRNQPNWRERARNEADEGVNFGGNNHWGNVWFGTGGFPGAPAITSHNGGGSSNRLPPNIFSNVGIDIINCDGDYEDLINFGVKVFPGDLSNLSALVLMMNYGNNWVNYFLEAFLQFQAGNYNSIDEALRAVDENPAILHFNGLVPRDEEASNSVESFVHIFNQMMEDYAESQSDCSQFDYTFEEAQRDFQELYEGSSNVDIAFLNRLGELKERHSLSIPLTTMAEMVPYSCMSAADFDECALDAIVISSLSSADVITQDVIQDFQSTNVEKVYFNRYGWGGLLQLVDGYWIYERGHEFAGDQEFYIYKETNGIWGWSNFELPDPPEPPLEMHFLAALADAFLDAGHYSLDLIGLVPGAGEIADGIHAFWYFLEGDVVNGSITVAQMVPFAGAAVTVGKWSRNVLKLSDNIFHSKNGLKFLRVGGEHRLQHVFRHTKDDLSKPLHGIFDDHNDVVGALDEAFEKLNNNSADVVLDYIDDWGSRVVVIKMNRRIGTQGGFTGAGEALEEIRLVFVQGTNDAVLTAYPFKYSP